jgi:NNMT/PNMT/TEMT family
LKLPIGAEAPPEAAGNADYPWSSFDPEAYFEHYYGDPHPDDDEITARVAEEIKRIQAAGNNLDIVDVGTGPNLIPFLAALPRAGSLTAWEFSESNIAWLDAELQRSSLRPQWRHFWNISRAAYGAEWRLPEDPTDVLREKCSLIKASIFELPKGRFDAATMFFCAESMTARRDEFEAAMGAFAGCVKPGGTLAAAFLVQSDGYEVSGRRFPALRVSPQEIEAVLGRFAAQIRTVPIGIVDAQIRSGYAGCAFLTAVGL